MSKETKHYSINKNNVVGDSTMQMVIDSDPIVGAIKLLFTVNGN